MIRSSLLFLQLASLVACASTPPPVILPAFKAARPGDLFLEGKIKLVSRDLQPASNSKTATAILQNVSRDPVKALVSIRWLAADGSLVTRGTQKPELLEFQVGEKVGVTSIAPALWVADFGLDLSDRFER